MLTASNDNSLVKSQKSALNMKTVLITGCSSGLGKALCQQARASGYRVVATARNGDRLPKEDEYLLPLQLDVNQPEQVSRCIAEAVAWAGKIDILINNAGFGQMGPLLTLPMDKLRLQMETNLVAPLAMTQAVVPHMPRHAGAAIVNIGSISALLSTPFAGAYCASKAALHRAGDALRMELKPLGIHLMTVQAGAIASEFANNANQLLPDTDGEYHQLSNQIKNRADASQANPTPATRVAGEIFAALAKPSPTNYLSSGYGSRLYPLLARLPHRLTDWLLCRRFGLNKRFENT